MVHGGFWTTDQAVGKPNFIEGGQVNDFGFTQCTFHKLHCLANLRMMLAWHITGEGDKMTHDMNVHAIHCLVSVVKPLWRGFGTGNLGLQLTCLYTIGVHSRTRACELEFE